MNQNFHAFLSSFDHRFCAKDIDERECYLVYTFEFVAVVHLGIYNELSMFLNIANCLKNSDINNI
jgi:hypothetical protein